MRGALRRASRTDRGAKRTGARPRPIISTAIERLPSFQALCYSAEAMPCASRHPLLVARSELPSPPGPSFSSIRAPIARRVCGIRASPIARRVCSIRASFMALRALLPDIASTPRIQGFARFLRNCYLTGPRFTKRPRAAHTVFNGARYAVSQQTRGSPPPLASAYPLKQSDANSIASSPP